MKKLVYTLFFLSLTTYSFGCSCQAIGLKEEIKQTKDIFVGRVIYSEDNYYKIEVLKRWKGNAPDTVELFQGSTSCETWGAYHSDYYVFFLNRNVVDNCSRTWPYKWADYVSTLDEQLRDVMTIHPKHTSLIDSLEYARQYVLDVEDVSQQTHKVDVNNKKIFYFDGKEPISLEIAKSKAAIGWSATTFHLIAKDVNVNNHTYQYVLYALTTPQVYRLPEEYAQKMLKKIQRKAKRKKW